MESCQKLLEDRWNQIRKILISEIDYAEKIEKCLEYIDGITIEGIKELHSYSSLLVEQSDLKQTIAVSLCICLLIDRPEECMVKIKDILPNCYETEDEEVERHFDILREIIASETIDDKLGECQRYIRESHWDDWVYHAIQSHTIEIISNLTINNYNKRRKNRCECIILVAIIELYRFAGDKDDFIKECIMRYRFAGDKDDFIKECIMRFNALLPDCI